MKENNTVKLIFKSVLPVVLLISGLIIFTSRISGWSLLIGLPLIIISTVFLIYSYDELSQKFAESEITNVTECSICGKMTNRDMDVLKENTICPSCQTRVSQLFKHRPDKK